MVREVPRLKYGDFNVQVTSPTVRGLDAGTEAADAAISLANTSTNLALDVMAKRAKLEGEAAGRERAGQEDFDPNELQRLDTTTYDLAFKEGAVAVYATRLDSDTRRQINQIDIEGGTPDEIAVKINAVLDTTRETLPPELAASFDQTFIPMRDRVIAKSQRQFLREEQQRVREETDNASQELMVDMSRQYLSSGGDIGFVVDAQEAYQGYVMAALAAGAINEAEAEQLIMTFDKETYRNVQMANIQLSEDPAEYIEQFAESQVNDENNPLTIDETRSLIRSMTSMANDIRQASIRADAEENEARMADLAVQFAEMDVMASRGELPQSELDQLREIAENTDDASEAKMYANKWAQLTKTMDRAQKERNKTLGRLQKVNAAINDVAILDEGNPEDRKAVDEYYQQRIVPMLQGADDVTLKSSVQQYVKTTQIIPKTLKQNIRGGLRSSNPEVLANAADMYARIEEVAPFAARDFAKKDVAVAQLLNKYLRAGTPLEEAVESVVEQTRVDNIAIVQARREAVKDNDIFDIDDVDIEDIFSGGPTIDSAAGLQDRVRSDFSTLFEKWYMQTGDADVAMEEAEKDIKNTWGVSGVTGDNRLMKYPPENYYRVGDDQSWIGQQLVQEVSLATGKAYKQGDVLLASDIQTARQATERAPTYSVLVKNANGIFEPMGKRYKPDPMKEYERLNLEADIERMRAQVDTLKAQNAQFQDVKYLGGIISDQVLSLPAEVKAKIDSVESKITEAQEQLDSFYLSDKQRKQVKEEERKEADKARSLLNLD